MKKISEPSEDFINTIMSEYEDFSSSTSLVKLNLILEKEINKTARTFALNNINQEENAINAIKTVCRKFTKEQVGKRPLTNINLVNI